MEFPPYRIGQRCTVLGKPAKVTYYFSRNLRFRVRYDAGGPDMEFAPSDWGTTVLPVIDSVDVEFVRSYQGQTRVG